MHHFRYDLKELSGKPYTVEHDGEKYVFGICADAKPQCAENVGACNVTGGQSSSMGTVSSGLQLSDEKSDSPFLLYKSGSVCGALGKQWTTKIEFLCQTDGMAAGPKIIENTNCTLIIQFATKLVCNNEVRFIDCTMQIVGTFSSYIFRSFRFVIRFNAKFMILILAGKLT